MGTWSTAIEGNDMYHDVQNDFFHLYDHEHALAIAGIVARLVDTHKEAFGNEEDEDHNNAWFSLAHALWTCGQSDETVYDKVATIIESGRDLVLWKALDATPKDLVARGKVLDAFLKKLQKPSSKPRLRRKVKTGNVFAPFQKGDCVAFRLDEGPYTGYVCLETKIEGRTNNEFYALFVATRFYAEQLPALEDFLNGQVLILQFGNWKDEIELFWLFPMSKRDFNKLSKDGSLQIIGKMQVPQIGFRSDTYGGFSSSAVEKQLDFERSTNPKRKILSLAKFLNGAKG